MKNEEVVSLPPPGVEEFVCPMKALFKYYGEDALPQGKKDDRENRREILPLDHNCQKEQGRFFPKRIPEVKNIN